MLYPKRFWQCCLPPNECHCLALPSGDCFTCFPPLWCEVWTNRSLRFCPARTFQGSSDTEWAALPESEPCSGDENGSVSREPARLYLFNPNNPSFIPQGPNSFQGPDLSNDSPITPPWGLSLVLTKSPEIGMIPYFSVEIVLSKADENRCIEGFPSRTPCLGFHPFLQGSAFNCQAISRNISSTDNLWTGRHHP